MEQSLIKNYRIEERLGSGGISKVWSGVDINTNEKVALKIIEKNFASDQKFRERFRRSAEVLKQLDHPNIVKLNELIDLPDCLGLAMECVDGTNLENFVNNNYDPATPLKILPFFLQILDALDYAHRNKIIHRDVKPSNILINRSLTAKLIDFDTVKDFKHDSNLTSSNFKLGTFTYISPEQLDDSRNVSPQSDIYSMGMVLFFILIGRPYFDKAQNQSFKEIVARIVKENLPSLSRLNRNIPPVFDAIISKATEKNAANRFKSCAEFKHHLIEQLNPYGAAEEIDLDKTQININPERNSSRPSPPPPPKPSPPPPAPPPQADKDKTFVNPRMDEPVSDKTQFFDTDKPGYTPNDRNVNPDATAFFESEHTAVFNDRNHRTDDEITRAFNRDSREQEQQMVYPRKRKSSLSAVDMIILIGGIIMFLVGMVFLYNKLFK